MFAAALLLSMLLVVAGVNVVYLLAMQVVQTEKLRDIILYFQIVMTVFMAAGYQIMPRLIDMRVLGTLDASELVGTVIGVPIIVLILLLQKFVLEPSRAAKKPATTPTPRSSTKAPPTKRPSGPISS